MAAEQLIVTTFVATDDVYSSPLSAPSFTAGTVAPVSVGWLRRNVATDGLGNWVVCGFEKSSFSNDDGVTWADTHLNGSPGTTLGIQSVIWDGSAFYAWADPGNTVVAYYITSPDGEFWDITQTVGVENKACSFTFFGTNWVTMFPDTVNPSPVTGISVAYNPDPTTGLSWTLVSVPDREWAVDAGVNPMPMTVASNDRIVLSFSVVADDLMWSEDVTAVAPFTAATFTGTGQIWCAVWDGSRWVGGGTYDSGGGVLKFNWATSGDGKAWTHHNEPTFGGWILADCFFDGTNCWFTAHDEFAAVPGAVFQFDGTTWTEWDLPGGTDGAYGIAGFPSFPIQIGAGHMELHADDAAYMHQVDSGHMELHAPDIVLVGSGRMELHADDAFASNAILGDAAHMQLNADNLIVLGSGVMMLHADDAEAPNVPSGNFNPDTPCTVGNQWFPRYRGAGNLASDLQTIGVWLTADRADDIAQVWPFIASVAGQACIAVEVFDVTNGNPTLDPITEFGYYPSSDLYVAAPPWTPGAFGPFTSPPFDPSVGSLGPFYEALNSTVLVPCTWPISGQPVAGSEFVFNYFGLGYDFAVRFDSVAGTQAGRWITNVRSRSLMAQYLALGATGAFQVQPYLWLNGTKYPGAKQSVDVSQGVVQIVADWPCNPATGLPWTPTDIDLFDTAFVGGAENGMGFICQPTGSSNNLATILQADLVVESSPSDPRVVIGSRCVNANGGWQRFLLRDPADSTLLDSFLMVPGHDYLFVFRRGAGTGSVSFAYLDDPNNRLPGPPNWTTHIVTLDPLTHRPAEIGSALTPAYAMSLVKTGGQPSLDSQPYMTLSPLDGVDRFPLINEYLVNSPVNSGAVMQSQFLAPATDEYGWIWILVAQVAATTDDDLTITIRDTATDTAQGVVLVTSDDLVTPRHSWQRIGVRMDPAPILNSLTEYYFDIRSGASPNQGWLVQVLDEGNEPPPQGGPVGTYRATWGGGAENLFVDTPLVEYFTKTACITISTIPAPPTGFESANLGEECCIDAMVLMWDEYTEESCGGWLAYELQRRNVNASTLVNSHAADWFRIAYIDTDVAVTSFVDYEAPNNITVEYRLRVWRVDGAPSDWSDTVSAETLSSCCGLTFTSNVSPELSVFYPDVAVGLVTRHYDFPENTQTFQPFDQNGSVVYRELENRFVKFDAKLKIRDGQLPCGPGCNNPPTGSGTVVFDPIRAISRAGLPYVAVKNETGDVWFAYVNAKSGDWTQAGGKEIDGGWALYTFDISVTELTNVPYVADEGIGGS